VPDFRQVPSRWSRVVVAMLLAFLVVSCSRQEPGEQATLVVSGARVWTGNPAQPWGEAIAASGDKILAVGSADQVMRLVGPQTRIIQANGGMLVPGFIDTHVHFVPSGAGLASVQLRDAATPEEFTRRIADFAAGLEPGEWIIEGTWDHQNWGGELPTREWIDQVTPDSPVWISRLDGHMGLANSLAMQLAGVDATTADVDGGTIVRGADGEPTGIFKDNAMSLIGKVIPDPSPAQLDKIVQAASAFVASSGVTSVHDMSYVGLRETGAYRRARDSGTLKTRIYSVIPLSSWETLQQEVASNGTGDEWVRIGGLKGFMDGSLGSHTAAMLEPFSDAPGDSGFMLQEPDLMEGWVRDADAAGLHVLVHAIGDKAIRSLLDIYQRVAEENGPRDRRFRIEHAQHIHPDDLGRFARQGIIASMQPYHAIDDGRWAEKVIGPERSKTTYAFASLINSGARVSFGSDWSVAPPTPLEGIFAALTRRTLDGAHPDGWVPEQKITLEQALKAYTVDAAYASYEEGIKGSLEPGKLADFVLLDKDLTRIAPQDIREVKVLDTIVGGQVVFAAE
jgi:predicted amidohydrolase YtcJ